MKNSIELELRAEVSLSQLDLLLSDLKKKQELLSHGRRLSVMFLGTINQINFDIRVRVISNGKTELVVKKGDYHAHDRTEFSQEIEKDQFIGIVKFFSLFGFRSKVTERENFVFDLGDNITMTLVKSGPIAYVEIEKMSHGENLDESKAELLHIISSFNLKLIDNGDDFDELCNRLTKDGGDWDFDDTASHMDKLEAIFRSY